MTYEEALKLFKDHEYMTDFSWQDEMSEVAIEALEKQIPKKPKITVSQMCKCPSCNAYIVRNLLNVTVEHCIRCGQAINWSEEEE